MPRLLLILQSLCNAQNLLEGHSLSELSPSLCVIGANASPAKIAFPQLCRWPSTRSVSHCKWSFPWYLAASQWRNAGPSFCICYYQLWLHIVGGRHKCKVNTCDSTDCTQFHPTHYSSISLTTQLSAYAESKSLCSRLGRPLTHSCRCCLLSPWPQQSAVIIILPKSSSREESERNQPPRDDMTWYDTGRFKNDCRLPTSKAFWMSPWGPVIQGNPTNTRPRNYIIKRQVRNL